MTKSVKIRQKFSLEINIFMNNDKRTQVNQNYKVQMTKLQRKNAKKSKIKLENCPIIGK